MSVRQNALNEWLGSLFKPSTYTLTAIPGDASFRQYFRVQQNDRNAIVMDAPPNRFEMKPFIEIANLLRQQGIHAPEIFASDERLGFALLEDLGDTLLFSQANSREVLTYYTKALDILITLQQRLTSHPQLPVFNINFMQREMSLFQSWFLEQWLGMQLTAAEKSCIQQTMQQLTSHLASQPQQFIHRDFHSRNLLVITSAAHPRLGVIDFQDAMLGPWTYDLVSLTKDCYLRWPEAQQSEWVGYFYQQLPNQFGWSLAEFQHAVDWCGLQRHLKVLGIFCRLHLRDKKSTYLHHLPLTLQHTMDCLARYSCFHPLYEFMQERVIHSFEAKQTR